MQENCLDLEQVVSRKAQIMVSRSFDCPVTALDELREAVISYIICAAAGRAKVATLHDIMA